MMLALAVELRTLFICFANRATSFSAEGRPIEADLLRITDFRTMTTCATRISVLIRHAHFDPSSRTFWTLQKPHQDCECRRRDIGLGAHADTNRSHGFFSHGIISKASIALDVRCTSRDHRLLDSP